MNTNQLKRFAQEARIKLIDQISAKLELVLTADSAELREKAAQIKKLQEAINATSKDQVIDKVAYTWFNRFMALRFMDVNGYQPISIQVVSPKQGYTLPELLDEAKQGHVPEELNVNRPHIYDLLDGKIPSTNAQNEAYKELLIGACNHLHKVFPFLFERINDYTELLLPDDLTSEFSILQDVRDGMSTEDCKEVEIIGWLYQFYISDRKDEVFASKSKVMKEDIPAATQLFTPRWIVEYMVQNTVGKLWLQNRSKSKLREHMPYFIESPSVTSEDYLQVNSPEEITLLDQACGSGHILVYGFELLSKIYEEEGYNPSEIPQLIIEKNLYGFEIDERAAQLAGFALMMKGRGYSRRFFRKETQLNILVFEDVKFDTIELEDYLERMKLDLFSQDLKSDIEFFEEATNLGSLIQPKTDSIPTIEKRLPQSDLFLSQTHTKVLSTLRQITALSQKFHCVVDNPPYMGGGNMNKPLSDFVKKNYPDSKADLMACFMEAGLKMLQPKGFLGMINQHSWMFLSSYEKLRKKLIKETFFDTLLHLGPRTFPEIGGEVVQNAAFTFWKMEINAKGRYIRLVDFENADLKRTRTLEAIQKPDCGWFYAANQRDFEKIPGYPIGYWVSQAIVNLFNEAIKMEEIILADGQNKTGNNDKFLRLHWEIEKSKFGLDNGYILYAKGGPFRKWHGNIDYVAKWDEKATTHYSKDKIARIIKKQYWFRKGFTFSRMSKIANVRVLDQRGTFDATTVSFFLNKKYEDEYFTLLGMFNSKVGDYLIHILNPTLVFQLVDIRNTPFKKGNDIISQFTNKNINISFNEWNSRETSLDFQKNELLQHASTTLSTSATQDLEETYDLYKQYWQTKFYQLHKNEEMLNKQFIEIYGLQEELTPDVPLGDITILKEELDQKKLKKLSDRYRSGWKLVDLPTHEASVGHVKTWILEESISPNPSLPFDAREVFRQFMSYAVGCIFGRYSLDKEGLILANQGETNSDFVRKVLGGKEKVSTSTSLSDRFMPDDDNIIPILDDEWFGDDIVGRFYEFLRASFGRENFEKNLAFLEECLGKDVRTYFVRDFYTDHIKRYKKRPIYWMFSSPKGSFNVLIYMHRYTPDTLNQILNNYLVEYREKLRNHIENLDHVIETGSAAEQTRAAKDKDRYKVVLLELQEYERDVLYPLATERIEIDLDDGVLVNYNKFGRAIKEVKGLNDKKTKKKVRGFDWIDGEEIR